MRRLASAVFVVATSGTLLTGALMDRSAVSVLGAPDAGGGCSSSCAVGGADSSNPGQARGGYSTGPLPSPILGDVTEAGTVASGGAQGHVVATGPSLVNGSLSGNFESLPGKGHCTGGYVGLAC
jgi:hypothetical protein